MTDLISLDAPLRQEVANLLSYPLFDPEEVKRRILELRLLGVETLKLKGKHLIDGVKVLGKGHVGIVIAASIRDTSAALKIRRIDADRKSFTVEAENLKLANQVSVGPKLIDASSNFLLMEIIEGDYLADWAKRLGPLEGRRMHHVLQKLMEKARKLDMIGLDHGELSKAHRHVIVAGEDPRIIDFESSSTRRRAANITSITNYLYFNKQMRTNIVKFLKPPEPIALLDALKRYKKAPTDANYQVLLRVHNLAN